MGIYASYYAITESQANEYKELLANNDDESLQKFFYDLENLDENDEEFLDEQYVGLDKLWEGLHFLLTGFDCDDNYNANKTPEQLALYYGFFGNNTLSDEGVYLVDNNKLTSIVKVLENINIDELLDKVDFEKFTEADLYPDIWEDEDEYEELCEELKEHFENFKKFYQNALKNNRHICIVIG